MMKTKPISIVWEKIVMHEEKFIAQYFKCPHCGEFLNPNYYISFLSKEDDMKYKSGNDLEIKVRCHNYIDCNKQFTLVLTHPNKEK